MEVLHLVLKRKYFERIYDGTKTTEYRDYTNYWKKSSRSFILITASYLILSHIDVLMIGILQDKEQSGIYAIASRIAALVAYGLYVSNIILMPYNITVVRFTVE